MPRRLLGEEDLRREVVVRDPWRQRGISVGLQRLRHPCMQRRAARVRQPVEHGLPGERVDERVAVRRTDHRFEHADRDRGVDRVHARAPVGRTGPDQRRQVEPVADHRGQLDGLPQLRAEPRQSGRDGVAEGHRYSLRAAQGRDTAAAFQVEPGLP
jgi:hypothetical protein